MPGQKPKQFIKEATFFGHVELHRPVTGDYLTCEDNLHVTMARTEQDGKAKMSIRQTVATGDVVAKYQASDIHSRRLVMNFNEVRNNQGKIGVRASTLDADGDVIVHTREDHKDKKGAINSIFTTVQADTLHADNINRSAEIHGQPAVIKQSPDGLEGEQEKKLIGDEIHLVNNKVANGCTSSARAASYSPMTRTR